jgi:hypothetical protein
MANQKLKFEDFQAEKLSKNQQKTVRGGDGDSDNDPGTKGTGSTGTGHG